ncbi:MAG: HYR domain-containing protein, partial [Flavobacteriaceae bacterium]|nr:HYR domain-containing protein [Flavobacteriaceae bacterium]
MKKITLGCIFLLCMLTSIGMMAQTMTFDSGPSEPGFSFSNWSSLTAGAINQTNLASPSTITRTGPGTWNATSFTVGPFTGNNTITVTSDQGDSQTFNSGSIQTVTLIGFNNITTLTFTRTGGSGPSADYDNLSYSVNPAGDTTPPTITCPSNIIQNNDAGNCGAIVTFMATATDNSGTATVTYSQNPGTSFPVGTTTVTATATDPSGNTSNCMFTVTVNDTEDPTIACPANITQGNDTG